MPQPLRPLLPITPEEWEDLCRECGGWEWIDGEATGKNEFGENVGRERLKEALEANEWDGGGGGIFNANDIDTEELESELGLLDDGSPTPRGIIDVRSDFAGMHEAILGQSEDVANDDDPGGGGDIQVEELEGMMLKMQAIKGLFRENPTHILLQMSSWLLV